MTSSTKKGNAREQEVVKILENASYVVMRSPRTMRRVGSRYFSSSNDFFGLFDICAKDINSTRWIQIKSHKSDYYKCRKAIAKFADLYGNPHDSFEIWIRINTKKRVQWEKHYYISSSWIKGTYWTF